MGLTGKFVSVTKEHLDAMVADPDSIVETLFPDDGETEPEGKTDIDKAWDGIHFLLTGTKLCGEEPWSLVILGGTEIGPDLGCGPARYLLPNQVREVAAALTYLPRKELERRYDPAKMDELRIYPEIWRRDGREALEYLLSYYDNVVKRYQEAAEQNRAMLLWVS